MRKPIRNRDYLPIVSKKLKIDMERKGLSKKQVAELTNSSTSHIGGILSKNDMVSLSVIYDYCKNTGTSVDWLLGLSDDIKPKTIRTYKDLFELFKSFPKDVDYGYLNKIISEYNELAKANVSKETFDSFVEFLFNKYDKVIGSKE